MKKMMKLNRYLTGLALACTFVSNAQMDESDFKAGFTAATAGTDNKTKKAALEDFKAKNSKDFDPDQAKKVDEEIKNCSGFFTKHKKALIIGGVVVAVLIVAAIGGFVYYKKKKSSRVSGASMRNSSNAGRITRRAK